MLKKLSLFLIILIILLTIDNISSAKTDNGKSNNQDKTSEVFTSSEKKEEQKEEKKEEQKEEKKEEKKEEQKEEEKGSDMVVTNSDKPITGVEKVEIKAEKNTVVDLQLQTNKGSLYLGRVKVEKDQVKTEFKWDSKNTPNGDYKLYGTINKQEDSSVIVGPVDVRVDNTETAIKKRLSEVEKKKVSSDRTLPSLTSPVPEVSQAPQSARTPTPTPTPLSTFDIVNVTTKDIVFPSEFDPKVVAVEPSTKIEKVKNTKLENNNVALSFSGKSLPNTIITLLIFSNPIVVTVKTDTNGTWTYHLEKPLSPGKHAVYTVAVKSDGTKIRSEVADFFIAPALAASSNSESLILASATEDKPLKIFAYTVIVIIGIGLLVLIMLFKYKRKISTVTPDDVS